MEITEREAIDFARYLINQSQIKPMSEYAIKTAYKRAKTTCEHSDRRASNDAQYDYEMECLEEELKKV